MEPKSSVLDASSARKQKYIIGYFCPATSLDIKEDDVTENKLRRSNVSEKKLQNNRDLFWNRLSG